MTPLHIRRPRDKHNNYIDAASAKAEVVQLRKDLKTREAELGSTREERDQLKSQLEDVVTERDQLKRKLWTSEARLAEEKRKQAKLQAQLNAKAAELGNSAVLQMQMQKDTGAPEAFKRTPEQFEQQLQAQQAQLETTQARLAEVERDNAGLLAAAEHNRGGFRFKRPIPVEPPSPSNESKRHCPP